jgi:glutathione-independent formaldehyde dehydrogenase
MRAVVFTDTRSVSVRDVPDAEIEEPTDAVIRVTSSAICGTDLHMYDGRTGATPGLVLGHEALGVIDRVGVAVSMVKPGDRVVIPTHLYCGLCVNCARGYSAACLRVRPGAFGAAYGYAGMGPYRGAQAELLRVPYADANCIPVPGEPGDELEDDFVLLAAYSALLKGAGEVYVVDRVADRLDKACELGATPIDFRQGDPVQQIRELRRTRGLPLGEEPMTSVQIGIDAVGFQATDRLAPEGENPTQVIRDLARLINPTGHLGIAGVFAERDLHPAPAGSGDGLLTVPWATFFAKGVSVNFGRTHDRRYTVLLRDLVLAGRARPGIVVTHHGPLNDAPDMYREFDRRGAGIIKAVLHPQPD